ncbi:helix-turn-helix domain-containing protein [Mesorhizobium sp. M1322]|uniref:helix-turn-helix domain-containing protein n=1 Tax=Mesorhizobium sp. M1322 TaxID=2957081 RepID=UPI0033353512
MRAEECVNSLIEESIEMASVQKAGKRSIEGLSTLNNFLGDMGKLEEFQAVAIKEVLAWQIVEAMKEQHLSRKRLAERMGTSRSQIGRLLDPTDGNVTLATLQRAAEVVGRKVRIELI